MKQHNEPKKVPLFSKTVTYTHTYQSLACETAVNTESPLEEFLV